jgi:methionyl-tRNA synthetase
VGVVPNYDGFHLSEIDAPLRSDHVVDEYKRAVEQFAPHLALQAVWEFVAQANEYIEKTAPFKLDRSDREQSKRLDVILGLLAETLRRLSVLVQAALPFTAEKIRAQLQLTPGPVRLEEALYGNSLRGHTVGKPQVIFPPIEKQPPAGI